MQGTLSILAVISFVLAVVLAFIAVFRREEGRGWAGFFALVFLGLSMLVFLGYMNRF
jgi:hypothetical protein